MRIYIANLGKYNEGELVGAWFTPPVDYDEMAERIGLNDRYEEYAMMLSRLVDTFFSRTSWTMLLYAENHSISVA